jgi:hypothetical protein
LESQGERGSENFILETKVSEAGGKIKKGMAGMKHSAEVFSTIS